MGVSGMWLVSRWDMEVDDGDLSGRGYCDIGVGASMWVVCCDCHGV